MTGRPGDGVPRVVDVHLHFLSPDAIDAARRRPGRYGVRVLDGEPPRLQVGDAPPTRPLLRGLYTLEVHAEFLAAQGIDAGVFGPLMDVAGATLPASEGAAWCRVQNETLAATLARASGRHRGLATLPIQDPRRAAEELAVAVKDFGLGGAMVDPHALGRPLGHADFDPLWKAADDLAAPVVLHPYALEAVERFGAHYLHNLVGYPFETTLAAGSLVLSGALDRVPGLTVVLVHGGGFLPYHVGRFDRAWLARPEARADSAARPSEVLQRFYYDSLVQHPGALAYLVGLVGADRVMLGSDHPFWLGDPEPVRTVREARLGADAERLVLGDNAIRIFHLDRS